MYWRHFWAYCEEHIYDSATICYWILYTKNHPGPPTYFKQKQERRIVEKLTKDILIRIYLIFQSCNIEVSTAYYRKKVYLNLFDRNVREQRCNELRFIT
jgi:hypothetical protein